jgi:hypothetical protein
MDHSEKGFLILKNHPPVLIKISVDNICITYNMQMANNFNRFLLS